MDETNVIVTTRWNEIFLTIFCELVIEAMFFMEREHADGTNVIVTTRWNGIFLTIFCFSFEANDCNIVFVLCNTLDATKS